MFLLMEKEMLMKLELARGKVGQLLGPVMIMCFVSAADPFVRRRTPDGNTTSRTDP